MDLHALLAPTERLRLRWLAPDDEADFCALYTCPRTMREIGEPLALEEARRRFAARLQMQRQTLETPIRLAPGPAAANRAPLDWPWEAPGIERPSLGVRVVAEPKDGEGFVALFGVDCWTDDTAQWELGAMAATGFQGQGLIAEGLRELSSRLLELGVSRVVMRCRAANLPALRVASRSGFDSLNMEDALGAQVYWFRLSSGPDKVASTFNSPASGRGS